MLFLFLTCSCSGFLSVIKCQERRAKTGKDAKFAHEREQLSILLHLKGTEKERMSVYSRKPKLAWQI